MLYFVYFTPFRKCHFNMLHPVPIAFLEIPPLNIWSQWIALDHVILFWNVWKLRSCLKLPFGTKFWSWKVQFTIVNLNEVDVTHLYFHSGAAAAIYACYCCLLVIHCDIEGVNGVQGIQGPLRCPIWNLRFLSWALISSPLGYF